ncbi:hypothetical protein HB852_10065 [Listeria grandensis]|uniref:Uncharacterized protein n=1 Tax=Listeria grandensis TaxID=1494963 RepID=A0A7X0Y4V1_9LIST|nr:hypothetical protein [Listeria grandensis]MBC1474962.1 hypothetical protein [Listeria grandensis]MBC1936898.1 hypothetical protein [Listeria grandensis]
MYSLLVLFTAGTYQIFGIVIVTNVLAQKVLSKKDIVIITIIMALGGPILLSMIEYFSQIYTLGVLVLFLRWKGIRWLNSFMCVVVAQIVLLSGWGSRNFRRIFQDHDFATNKENIILYQKYLV